MHSTVGIRVPARTKAWFLQVRFGKPGKGKSIQAGETENPEWTRMEVVEPDNIKLASTTVFEMEKLEYNIFA